MGTLSLRDRLIILMEEIIESLGSILPVSILKVSIILLNFSPVSSGAHNGCKVRVFSALEEIEIVVLFWGVLFDRILMAFQIILIMVLVLLLHCMSLFEYISS